MEKIQDPPTIWLRSTISSCGWNRPAKPVRDKKERRNHHQQFLHNSSQRYQQFPRTKRRRRVLHRQYSLHSSDERRQTRNSLEQVQIQGQTGLYTQELWRRLSCDRSCQQWCPRARLPGDCQRRKQTETYWAKMIYCTPDPTADTVLEHINKRVSIRSGLPVKQWTRIRQSRLESTLLFRMRDSPRLGRRSLRNSIQALGQWTPKSKHESQ